MEYVIIFFVIAFGVGFLWGIRYSDRFYNSENEVGVSDASTKHGDLPPVREWNAHGSEADNQIASEHGAFRNRINSESLCDCPFPLIDWEKGTCSKCNGSPFYKTQTKES